MTVGKAIDRYISEKTGTLSPSTIQGYKVIRRNYLQDIMNDDLYDLSQSYIQLAVSQEVVKGRSPKTIRNAHGLLAAVLNEFRPDFVLKTRLPQKEQYEARIFTEEELLKVLKVAEGGAWELPILMGCWLGLRMSEIRGLRYGDFKDGMLHIHTAVVNGPDGSVEKGPKTTAGDRWIKVPERIQKLVEKRKATTGANDYSSIFPLAANTIWRNFVYLCNRAGVEPCRFHDLRHFAASEALALGIPDKYTMKRMGHKTDHMLKNVYQHTMRNKEDQFANLIDEKMEKLFESGHENGHTDDSEQQIKASEG